MPLAIKFLASSSDNLDVFNGVNYVLDSTLLIPEKLENIHK